MIDDQSDVKVKVWQRHRMCSLSQTSALYKMKPDLSDLELAVMREHVVWKAIHVNTFPVLRAGEQGQHAK